MPGIEIIWTGVEPGPVVNRVKFEPGAVIVCVMNKAGAAVPEAVIGCVIVEPGAVGTAIVRSDMDTGCSTVGPLPAGVKVTVTRVDVVIVEAGSVIAVVWSTVVGRPGTTEEDTSVAGGRTLVLPEMTIVVTEPGRVTVLAPTVVTVSVRVVVDDGSVTV